MQRTTKSPSREAKQWRNYRTRVRKSYKISTYTIYPPIQYIHLYNISTCTIYPPIQYIHLYNISTYMN